MGHTIERIKAIQLQERIIDAELAASWIQDGMTLGLSGFTRAGDAKAVPLALIKRAETESLKVNVFTGASLGSDIDRLFAEAGIVGKRLPFQADPVMRRKINEGEMLFVDHHLSQTAEWIKAGVIEPIDFAIIEALGITEERCLKGYTIFTTPANKASACRFR
jgi:succinyl-CoA:acetate CoA-transferase